MKPEDNPTWIDLEEEYTDFLWTEVNMRTGSNKIPNYIIDHMTNSLFGTPKEPRP